RFAVVMVGLVTLSVLLLSAVGISAMMSFAVTRRYREIGIRSALGASRRQVLRTIFSRSALQLGLGVAVGAIFTALLDRISGGEFLNGQEHVLVPMVAALVIVAGLLATAGPARRALRVQPIEALRLEGFSRITAADPPARSPARGPRTRTHARAAAARGG